MLSRKSGVRRHSRKQPFALLVIVFVSTLSSATFGQIDPTSRPSTQELLPETTVAFVQVNDFRDLMEKFRETGFGQLLQEEGVASLMRGLWEESELAYQAIKDDVGVSLEEIQALPAGELTFAVIAPRRKKPEYMMILELDEESESLDRLLDRGRELFQKEGGKEVIEQQNDDGIKLESFNVKGQDVKLFRLGGLVVGSTSEAELDAFVARWAGREVKKVRPLSVNRKFVTIMNRCAGDKELKPEARFYVDPIAIIKSANTGNASAQVALSFLPALGLDGFLGIGGSWVLTEDEFESVVHGHVLFSDPRSGILEMTALKPTTYEPESWLPADVYSYLTTSWDVDKMLAELTTMVDSFRGEGTFDQWIESNVTDETGLDLKEDMLAHITGRLTYLQWIGKDQLAASSKSAVALELSDAEAFESSLEAVVARINEEPGEDGKDRIEELEYQGIRYWNASAAPNEEREQKRGGRGEDDTALEVEPRQLAFAIVGNHFLFSPENSAAIKLLIETDQGDRSKLVDAQGYQEVAEKMTGLIKADTPCAMAYSNPEHAFRMTYQWLLSKQTVEFLERFAGESEYIAGVKQQMEDNPLPPFEELKKYFRPVGGFATTDETGYHFLRFSLRESPSER